MAGGIGSVISSFVVDVVGVYTNEFAQVFRQARPIKASIKEENKLMEHPLETGASVVDHRIILPVEIELSMIIQASDYRDVYQQIKQISLNATILSVHTKAAVYENQVIAGLPHDEDPEMYDVLTIALKLKEVQFFDQSTVQYAPRNANDSKTVDRGGQQPQEPTPERSSAAAELLGL